MSRSDLQEKVIKYRTWWNAPRVNSGPFTLYLLHLLISSWKTCLCRRYKVWKSISTCAYQKMDRGFQCWIFYRASWYQSGQYLWWSWSVMKSILGIFISRGRQCIIMPHTYNRGLYMRTLLVHICDSIHHALKWSSIMLRIWSSSQCASKPKNLKVECL